jgi:hypothetical protein
MNEPRDTLVGDALRRLDVPDHAPDFWTALTARLGDGPTATDEPPTDGEETTVVDLQGSPAARRAAQRSRTSVFALAAAVAVVVALVVGIAVLSDGDGDGESQLDVADDLTETPETSNPDVAPPPVDDDASAETTAPPETTTSIVPGDELDAYAEQTAVAWIDALGDGDMDGAYGLLDDQTRTDLDQAQFQELSSGLAEGAAAFAQDGVEREVSVVTATDGLFHVVTFTGDVEREGMIETASYPVVVTGTGVHFTLDGPQLELDPEYARSSGTTLAAPLEVLVSETADTWLWIDDQEPERFLSPGRLTLGAEAIGPGTHVVSLVAIQGGAITARSYTVVVP